MSKSVPLFLQKEVNLSPSFQFVRDSAAFSHPERTSVFQDDAFTDSNSDRSFHSGQLTKGGSLTNLTSSSGLSSVCYLGKHCSANKHCWLASKINLLLMQCVLFFSFLNNTIIAINLTTNSIFCFCCHAKHSGHTKFSALIYYKNTYNTDINGPQQLRPSIMTTLTCKMFSPQAEWKYDDHVRWGFGGSGEHHVLHQLHPEAERVPHLCGSVSRPGRRGPEERPLRPVSHTAERDTL